MADRTVVPPDVNSEAGVSRRSFLQLSGAMLVLATWIQGIGRRSVETAIRWGIPIPWYRQGPISHTFTVCDMCPWHCGIIVETVNGVVHKIDGNPNDPKSRGRLCAKGQGGVSFLYDPDRLKTPLIRTGDRGAGDFREASWPEALDYIAQKMGAIRTEHGPESIAFLGHTGGDSWFVDHLAQAWGSPNAGRPSTSLCTGPRDEAALLTTGLPIGGHEPVDWDQIEAFALIGSHIGEDTRNTVMQDFSKARARGAKVVVVDPRFSTAASKADLWLPIKPGTDTALLLAWIHVLIEEERYEAEYVDTWTVGFEQLRDHVANLTPEWASEITELHPDLIRESARMLADARPRAAIVPGRHVTWYGNDTQRMRAAYIFNALLGAWGQPGGLYLNKSPYIESYPHPPYAVVGSAGGCSTEPGESSDVLPLGPSGKARADGARDTFWRGPTAIQELIDPMITGDPYPIKGLIAFGINMLHSIPNPDRTKQAFEALDLFVAIDVLPQDHIAWADVVLPEATYLERHDDLLTTAHLTPYVALREPAVAPLFDTKPGWWIARELGLRLGLDQYFAWETADEWINTRLRSIGSSIEKLRDSGGVIVQQGQPYLADFSASPFMTPSGLIELWSESLEAAGHDPLPTFEPTEEPPAGYFRLLYGRHPAHTFAKTQNTPQLAALFSENTVWVGAAAAKTLGISSDDKVMLENQDGVRSGPIGVSVTERIRNDAVYMVHGFGHESPDMHVANGRGVSDAGLQTRYALDPISGGAGMRVNFVKLERTS